MCHCFGVVDIDLTNEKDFALIVPKELPPMRKETRIYVYVYGPQWT